MSVKTKQQLRDLFISGSQPDSDAFGDLIDTMRSMGEMIPAIDVNAISDVFNGNYTGRALPGYQSDGVTPKTLPTNAYFQKWYVNQAGTFPGLLTSGGTPLVIVSSDFTNGVVDIIGENNVFQISKATFDMAGYVAKGTGVTDAVNIEVKRTPETVSKSYSDLFTGGTNGSNANMLTGRYHFNSPLGISDKKGIIGIVEILVTGAGDAIFSVGKSNTGGFTETVSTPVLHLGLGVNTIDLSVYNLPIIEGQHLAVRGDGATPASIFYRYGMDSSWHFHYQPPTGSIQTGTPGSYWAFKYTVIYSNRSALFDTFATPTDVSARVDMFLQKVQLNLSAATALPNAGATGANGVITIPAGQTGQYSYVRIVLPASLQSLFIGKTIQIEMVVKSTANLLLANMNASANGVGAFGGVKSLLSNDGTYNYYNCAISIPVTSGTASIQPYVQTGNPTVLAATGTFEIVNACIGIVSSTGVSVNTVQSQIVDAKIGNAVAEAIAAIRVGIPETIITCRKNGTVGVDCDFAGNRAIQDANESITNANAGKPYRVYANGFFEVKTLAEFNSNGITAGAVSFIRMKDYVSLTGFGKGGCIISGELPDNLTSTIYQNVQTMYCHANQCTIENVTILGRNLRYPLHIDGGATGCKNFYTKFRNCRIVHHGNFNNAATGWTSMTAFGYGASDGQIIDMEYCEFNSPFAGTYLHNNTPYTKGTILNFTDCHVINNGNGRMIYVQSLGSRTSDIMNYKGCSFGGGYEIRLNDQPWIPTALADQEFNHADIKLKGSGVSPFVVYNDIRGFALKITSKAGTSVRFDTNSTAFPLIIKDKDYDATMSAVTSEGGETRANGYAYRDGNAVIKGYALGRLDIGAEVYGLTLNTYGKSLGKRLGDCSVINKTLTVIVDGTSYDVVFNKNYSGGTNSSTPAAYSNPTIMTEITAVIGSVATVSEFSVGAEYFPEFTDYMTKCIASEEILKGMAVYRNGLKIRKALSTDTKIYGIALDDIQVDKVGRVQTKGYILTGDTRFNILMETYTAVVSGETLGVSATAAGKFSKTAPIKTLTSFENGVVSFNI